MGNEIDVSSGKASLCGCITDIRYLSCSEGVLLLDLDKCSFFGDDGNDLGITLQWMRKSDEEVVQLYRLLLNPCVRQTYDALKTRHADLKVVIYTARSVLVKLRPFVRGKKIITRSWNPDWIDEDQVFFPPHLANADEILEASAQSLGEMLPSVRQDLRRKLQRLLATRQVICEALELDAMPDVVVTAAPKDVQRTVRRLGYATHHAYLWDDNENLRGEPRVLTVPPFVQLSRCQRARVLEYLHEHVPPEALEQKLVDFLFGAASDSCSLARTADGGVEYRIPEDPVLGFEPWPLPSCHESEMALQIAG